VKKIVKCPVCGKMIEAKRDSLIINVFYPEAHTAGTSEIVQCEGSFVGVREEEDGTFVPARWA
jgi:hypothetical protein